MFKIFNKITNFDFIGKRNLAFILSGILILAGLVSFVSKGFQYGIDFRGGTQIQIKFEKTPALTTIRDILTRELDKGVNISRFGEESHNEILVSVSQGALEKIKNKNVSDEIEKIFQQKVGKYEIRRVETIGPKVGDQLKTKALEAVLYSMIGILIYIWLRFRLIYGVGAVVALFHDVIITLGFFSMFDKEITLTVIAALLTLVGYSLNDTIVIFDRIRENMTKLQKKSRLEIINISINENLSRTILTSLTTFFVVACLFILGGDIIHDFGFAMMIGLVVGTYSSIFVASPIVLFFDRKKGQ